MWQVHAGDVGSARSGSGGHCHDVDLGRQHIVDCGLSIEHDAHARRMQATRLVVDPVLVPAVGASERGDRQRAAQMRVPLPQLDAVAALGAQRRELGARRTASHDQHGASSGGRRGFRLGLTTEAGIDAAGVDEPIDQLAVDALVQRDARPHSLLGAGAGLGHDLGIGHRGPGHGHDVGVAGGQHRLGLVDVCHAPGVDDGEVGGVP